MRIDIVLSVLALSASALYAQKPAPPAFDVASVKAAEATAGRGDRGGFNGLGMLGLGKGRAGNFTPSPGGLTALNATLSGCIQWAYGVSDYQVSGPAWITEDRFNIAAKAPGEASEDQVRTMLQALLADRFQLSFHRQSKEMQAYALVIAKNGPKLKESTTDGPPNVRRERLGVAVEGATVRQLAEALTMILQVPVVDDTGLKGRYDATVDVTPYIPLDNSGPADLMSIAITALQDLLGLKLEARKMPVDILVVDRAERTPRED
jgi:uncharacterized protein (TIGR03435 family)